MSVSTRSSFCQVQQIQQQTDTLDIVLDSLNRNHSPRTQPTQQICLHMLLYVQNQINYTYEVYHDRD